MKTQISTLLLSMNLALAARAEVQVLHSFEFGLQYPQAQLVLAADGNFYGTAPYGGASATSGGAGDGGIFRATPAGVITNIASFLGTNGANPIAGLTSGPGGLLFGTTQNGGANNLGAVFSVSTSGGINLLYSFDGTHGSVPQTALTLGNAGNFYGTTHSGGANGDGTIFQITPGGALTTLFSFGPTNYYPGSSLCLGPDGNFYGTTEYGPANGSGAYSSGTIYQITPAGNFTQLVGLTNDVTSGIVGVTGSWLISTNGVMLGTLYGGSTNGYGCAFSLTTNGVFTSLAAFSSLSGLRSIGGLAAGPNGSFYGTCYAGGSASDGTLFRLQMSVSAGHTNWALIELASFNGATNGTSSEGGVTFGNDGNLYGVTIDGGDTSWGEFFSAPTTGPITGLASFNNAGGISPRASLTLAPDGNFYGTTYAGGPGDDGTVFRISTNGVFSRLATFSITNGISPLAPLCLGPDGALYGTASASGPNGSGMLFSITTNGMFNTLVEFSGNTSGSYPLGGLALGPDNQLYGTAESGGTNGSYGTIFCYNTNGTFKTVFSFAGTNGSTPKGTLFWNTDGFCYGTTYNGGTNGNGTIFRFNANGNFSTVATFQLTNGYYPVSGLTRGADGALYGSTYNGPSGYGIIYRCTTNGTLVVANSEALLSGSVQYAGFTPGSDGLLYTVTFNGGVNNNAGTLIRMNTNGVASLISALSSALGTGPYGPPLFAPDGYLYGTTSAGGPGNGGTIYRYVFDHINGIQRVGTNAIVTATGTGGGHYGLFATTNLVSGIWTNIAIAVATNSSVVLADTNAGKFPQRFYRTAAQ